MFGMMEAMLGFVRRQIGLRDDAASATGSLHAKITELRNYIASTIIKSRSFAKGAVSSGARDVWVTVLNYTGRGTLILCAVYCTGTGPRVSIRVTIDGVEIFTKTGIGSEDQWSLPSPDFLVTGGMSTTGSIANMCSGIPFKSSIKIEICRTSDYGSGQMLWAYEYE